MSEERYSIPASVIDKVTSALNTALGLALVKEPSLQPKILEAATALDDAVNDQPDD